MCVSVHECARVWRLSQTERIKMVNKTIPYMKERVSISMDGHGESVLSITLGMKIKRGEADKMKETQTAAHKRAYMYLGSAALAPPKS